MSINIIFLLTFSQKWSVTNVFKSIEQIKIFKSEKLPHLTVGNINGVTNIHYDVDCSLASNEKITNIIKILSEIDTNN